MFAFDNYCRVNSGRRSVYTNQYRNNKHPPAIPCSLPHAQPVAWTQCLN
jgi:hypothetical protein